LVLGENEMKPKTGPPQTVRLSDELGITPSLARFRGNIE